MSSNEALWALLEQMHHCLFWWYRQTQICCRSLLYQRGIIQHHSALGVQCVLDTASHVATGILLCNTVTPLVNIPGRFLSMSVSICRFPKQNCALIVIDKVDSPWYQGTEQLF
jgi:hypothetical protein